MVPVNTLAQAIKQAHDSLMEATQPMHNLRLSPQDRETLNRAVSILRGELHYCRSCDNSIFPNPSGLCKACKEDYSS